MAEDIVTRLLLVGACFAAGAAWALAVLWVIYGRGDRRG